MITVRILLTLLMIYGVYTETGLWTAISLSLIFLSIEALNYTQSVQDGEGI